MSLQLPTFGPIKKNLSFLGTNMKGFLREKAAAANIIRYTLFIHYMLLLQRWGTSFFFIHFMDFQTRPGTQRLSVHGLKETLDWRPVMTADTNSQLPFA